MTEIDLHQRLLMPLKHPLETAATTLTAITDQMRQFLGLGPVGPDITRHVLRFLVDAFGFDAAALVTLADPAVEHAIVETADQSKPGCFYDTLSAHMPLIAEQSASQVTDLSIASRSGTTISRDFSMYVPSPNGAWGGSQLEITVIPVTTTYGRLVGVDRIAPDSALVLARDTQSTAARSGTPITLDEPIARIFGAVVRSVSNLATQTANEFEEAVLDSLRSAYYSLPSSMVQRRLALFTQRLTDVSFAFQPIFDISSTPFVHSWEALARYGSGRRSPSWLFDTARLWGADFLAAVDRYALTTSVDQFTSALGARPSAGHVDGPNRLAVNVTAGSVTNAAYWDDCQRIMSSAPRIKLTLEISEKFEFVSSDDDLAVPWMSRTGSAASELQIQLRRYRDLGCDISMDDFGVEYSSIVRAMALRPDHIKLDRQVMTSAHPQPVLRFAQDLATSNNSAAIVEGVETIEQLGWVCDANVDLVQGYIFSRPNHDLSLPGAARMSRLEDQMSAIRARGPRTDSETHGFPTVDDVFG